MKIYILCYILTISLFIGSCKKNSTESTSNHSVSGTIISNGSPISKASVSLNKRVDLSVETDTAGHFTITNVPDGEYSLNIEKTNSDGSFLAKTSNISVTNDVIIQTLILPKGVKLDSLKSINSNTITISWNSTDANDFREYKLYRHLSSGLDETTGLLVHVSTAINDTQFVDNTVNPLTKYYYRVYVMNDFGKLGGSNIVSLTTVNKNAILNNSFENLDVAQSFPSNWSYWGASGKFLSESQIGQDGAKSIRLQLFINDWGVNSWGLYQQISPSGLEQGKTYKLSFWCKADSLEQYESMSCHFSTSLEYGTSSLAHLYNFIEGPKSANNWTQYSYTFTVPALVPSNYYLIFDAIRAGTSGYSFHLPMTVWFDNIELEKVQ